MLYDYISPCICLYDLLSTYINVMSKEGCAPFKIEFGMPFKLQLFFFNMN